jgi:hypothetical protein
MKQHKKKEHTTTSRQDECIVAIARTEHVSGKEARKRYYALVAAAGNEEAVQEQILNATPMETVERKTTRVTGGTWTQTKLGVTMVLKPEDCRALGFSENLTTAEVVRQVRQMLKLPERVRGGAQ